tara:strand:- start:196 stop:459 length:264 start_codon:yes stop_codon:yes gene_type:complete
LFNALRRFSQAEHGLKPNSLVILAIVSPRPSDLFLANLRLFFRKDRCLSLFLPHFEQPPELDFFSVDVPSFALMPRRVWTASASSYD